MTVVCCGTIDGEKFRECFVRPRWLAVLQGAINGWDARRNRLFTYFPQKYGHRRYLARLWSEMLGSKARRDDNFFDLGGHSILAVQMVNRVARDTGVRINLIRLGTDTLAEVAEDLPTHIATASPVPSAGESIGNGLRRLLGLAGATKQ